MHDVSTVICVATGPSVTRQQVDVARTKGRLFICNNAFLLAPDAELLYAVNLAWWRHYWPQVRGLPCEKWSTNREAAHEYGLHWIAETYREGLCEEPNLISHGHGSGFSLVSMAHKKGAKRIVLLGYDLKYAQDYDGRSHYIGFGPRHFFGEYPASMQHWPSVAVKNGEHVELLRLYAAVQTQGLVELVNATPGSALTAFLPYTPIEEC